jgi:hypothetical protein
VDPKLTRRSFLLAGAGLAVAAACGRDDSDVTVKPDRDQGPTNLSLVVASYVHTIGVDERVALALLQGSGPATPTGPITVAFKSPDGAVSPAVPATVHQEGISLPYFPVRHRFTATGVHEAVVTYAGRTFTAAINVNDTTVPIPIVGKPLISVPTPTVADPRGVDPICTKAPTCPLHDMSLDAALAAKRPVALLFSTPARCKSRLCGPVLENLLVHHEQFRDRVQFIHVEIYQETTSEKLAPAVEAYKLPGEPFLFLAGADGIVRDRLDNAFDRVEARAALERLVA